MPSLRERLGGPALVLLLLVGLALPAWLALAPYGDGRDFATFHCAVVAWEQGLDPYDVDVLGRLARDAGTRDAVYPWFYPPPALWLLGWTAAPELVAGHRLMAGLNVVALAATAFVLARWLRVSAWVPGVLLVLCSGAVETARLGQVNGIVGLLVAVGLWRGLGVPVALAALVKMSPAALLLRWFLGGRWRPALVATAVGLGGVALGALFMPHLTRTFFSQVLPALGDGGWNGLDVPLSFRANHSLPGLLQRLLPGDDPDHLSAAARALSSLLSLSLLGGLSLLLRRRRDALGEGLSWGALLCVIVVTPVYTWEHHHALLLLPMTAAATALLRGRLPRWAWAPFMGCVLVWAWRLPWWRAAWKAAPALRPAIEESKLVYVLVLMGLCVWGAVRDDEA